MVFFFKKKKKDQNKTGTNICESPPVNASPPPVTSLETYAQHDDNKERSNSKMQHFNQSFIRTSEPRLYPSDNPFSGYRIKDTEYHDKNSDIHVSVHVNSLGPKQRDSHQYYATQPSPYVSTNGNSYEHFTYACNNPACQVGNIPHNEHAAINDGAHENPWSHSCTQTPSKQCSHRPLPQYTCQPMIHTARPLPVNNTTVPVTPLYHHHHPSSQMNVSHSYHANCQKSYPTPRLPVVVPLHPSHAVQPTRAFYSYHMTPARCPSFYSNRI